MENIIGISKLAPITSFLILDTIAIDCLALNDGGLEDIFHKMFQTTSVVGYISEFSKLQVHRRFDIPNSCVEFTSLCSVDTIDYITEDKIPSIIGTDPHVLLVGNHFSHKYIRETLDAFKNIVNPPKITVLGIKLPEAPGMQSFASGELEQSLVDDLYNRCSIVLFPSHYEGFGFPVMHVLSRKKPIIARSLPVYDEIRNASAFGHNIYLRNSTDEMVDFACKNIRWAEGIKKQSHTWNDFAFAMDAAIANAIPKMTYGHFIRD